MGATVSISLPIPKSRGSNGRDHWAAKAKLTKADRLLARITGGTVSPAMPLRFVALTIAYRVKGKQGPDVDNAISRCKAYLDGLTDAGWWVDDRVLVEIRAAVFRCCGKDEGVTITAKDVEKAGDAT